MPNQNTERLKSLMRPGETYVRLTIVSPSGTYAFPARGCTHPDTIPANIAGVVLIDFFDSSRYPTRKNEPATLLGETTQQAPAQTQPSVQPEFAAMLNQLLQPSAQATNTSGLQSPKPTQTQQPNVLGSTLMPSTPTGQAEPSLPLPRANDAHPDLAREVLLAQATQLRSQTLQMEEAAGSAIELEKMAIVREAQYTREVAEWQQLGSSMRRELYATQTAYQEKAFRQLDLVDVSAHRLLRMADEVARRLKDPLFQPAPQPPPPPPPPPNYAAIAVAAFQALGRVGAAWSPQSKRKLGHKRQGQRRQDTVLDQLAKAASAGPEALQNTLKEMNTAVEQKSGTDAQKSDDSISITKEGLLKLIESGVLSSSADKRTLADLIRDNKLDDLVRLLSHVEKE